MSAAYRYDWGARFEDQVDVLDPIAGLASPPGVVGVRTYRGNIRADDGMPLPYRLWLPASPRGAVLLLHGACDYSGAFDIIGPFFAKHGYAAVAFDQRGFGQTPTRGKWAGTRRLARDVGAAASFVGKRVPNVPVFVVGESMGAALAVLASARGHIAGVDGLVLAAPGAIGCSFRRAAFGVATRVLQSLGARADVFVERIRCDDLASDAAIRLLADPLVLRRITPSLVGGLVRLGVFAFDEAAQVDVPTLTLVGSREDVSRVQCIRGLQHRQRGEARLCEFDGGPHLLLHWRERDRVLDTILAWLDEHVESAGLAHPAAS